ncbi:SGNH hydrolase domain-containing protein [Macrococcus bovicus]|uniref:SGNH hydrolase domain-containing protein n=1 Tax=Macrococcus bovicus TaxID=69968 RepID=UPI0025A5540F|nr:SGNH hydrolase domain-containing protein [Macrococcus bovicus]WJP98173.1 SGNH hydrolase domain-containing protein [Macrococcus bovicus]
MKKLFVALLLLLAVFHSDVQAAKLNPALYPGARSAEVNEPVMPVIPSVDKALADMPQAYRQKVKGGYCHAGTSKATVSVCKYGMIEGYDYTLAIIGDSHAGQWLGAVQEFANKNKIRIVYATKSACALTTDVFTNYANDKNNNTCTLWNKSIIPTIARYKPDLVLTKADSNSGAHPGTLSQGFINKYNELKARNIEVFAIRDTPYFHIKETPTSRDMFLPACVDKYGRNSSKCRVSRKTVLPTSTDWTKLANKPSNVHYIDYSRKICGYTYCYPVKGNVMIIRDQHHLTDSFARTFSTYIERDMMPILREVRAKKLAAATP